MKDLLPAIARYQHGVFTARQAIDHGISQQQVDYRLRHGRWLRVAGRGIALGSAAIGPMQLAVAACLTWPAATVCLDVAAELHSIPVERSRAVKPRPVHVFVPTGRRSTRNIVPHKVPLPDDDVVVRGILRVTSRRRTVLDCLALLDRRSAEGVCAWAITRNLLADSEVEAGLGHAHGFRGAPQQRRLLTRMRVRAASGGELELHRILNTAGLTGWMANATVRDTAGRPLCVDILFERDRVIVELDGLTFHGSDRLAADLARHIRLIESGYRVLHLTPNDLSDPFRVIDRILETGRGPSR